MEKQSSENTIKVYKRQNEKLEQFPTELIKIASDIQTLDFSSNKFKEFPPFDKFKEIITLVFNDNKISTLPPHLFSVTTLRKIVLSQNGFTSIPDGLSKLTNVTQLNLSQNKLSQLPPSLSSLVQLKNFSLSTNRLSTLPHYFSRFTCLTTFEIDHNNFNHFPLSLCNMSSLAILNISGNPIKHIPISLTKVKSLKTLSCQYIDADQLPSYLINFPLLMNVDLDHNPLTSIQLHASHSIKDMTLGELNVKELSLQRYTKLFRLNIRSGRIDQISDLPNMNMLIVENVGLKKIDTFPEVGEISLAHNQLKQIPSLNTSIHILNVKDNYLSYLENLDKYNLIKLDICGNSFDTLPIVSTTIRTLLISSNKLKVYPEAINEIVSLRHLDISDNFICSIPTKTITQLESLEKFLIHDNYISRLPTEFSMLKKLRLIGANDNRLTQFPLSYPKSLNSLMISHNQITVIPNEITGIELNSIDISDNEIVSIKPLLQNKWIKTINASHNPLHLITSDLKELIDKKDTKLQRLNISGYPIDSIDIFKEKQTWPITLFTFQIQSSLITIPITSYDEIPSTIHKPVKQLSFAFQQSSLTRTKSKNNMKKTSSNSQ